MIRESSLSLVIGMLGIEKNVVRLLLILALPILIEAFSVHAQAQAMGNPVRIAEGSQGQVYVADSLANAVFALDKQTMQTLWSLQVSGEPLAVASLGDLVLVSNRTIQALEVYGPKKEDKKYRLLYAIGGGGTLQLPGDLTVDTSQQRVIVLDRADAKVKVFALQGNLIFQFSPVDSLGRVLAPKSITVDETNQRILVSDYGDPTGGFNANVPPRVLIYDYAGTYLRQIDGDGIVDSVVDGIVKRTRITDLIFSRPMGLTVNHIGHLFLVDCVLSQVFVFDLNNWLDSNSVALIKKLGEPGNGPGQLNFPLDVLVDSGTGDVFVTNHDNGRVEVYRGGGIIP